MIKHVVAALLLVLVLSGCSTGSLFKKKTVFRQQGCDIDLTQPVVLQRLSFRVPHFWAKSLPCRGLNVIRDTYRDDWGISATLAYREGQAVVVSSAAGFLVGSDIHILGRPTPTPDEWLAQQREQWAKSDMAAGHPPTRDVKRVRRGQFDCWRISTQTYSTVSGKPDQYEQAHRGLGYTCWVLGDNRYPPFELGMGIGYWEGKPLYDIDMDREIMLPVFETLEVRELSEKAYARRIADYQRRQAATCRRHAKYAQDDGTANISESRRRQLMECGYDPVTLRRIQ